MAPWGEPHQPGGCGHAIRSVLEAVALELGCPDGDQARLLVQQVYGRYQHQRVSADTSRQMVRELTAEVNARSRVDVVPVLPHLLDCDEPDHDGCWQIGAVQHHKVRP